MTTTPSRDRHDMHNAILAIQTAVHALDSLGGDLPSGEREFLREAVGSAAARLEKHIATDEAIAIRLDEFLAAVVAISVGEGAQITIEGRAERPIAADEAELRTVLAGVLNSFGIELPIVCSVAEREDGVVVAIGRRTQPLTVSLRFALA